MHPPDQSGEKPRGVILHRRHFRLPADEPTHQIDSRFPLNFLDRCDESHLDCP